ncbi:uncharacterized protein METZ01_LOCUS53449 [marine metagenome]|uniref:Uncharacterized protein n=1 Tax=marine metagenome TaxID=408172 RepID=A0A381S936_9ZZZZ
MFCISKVKVSPAKSPLGKRLICYHSPPVAQVDIVWRLG